MVCGGKKKKKRISRKGGMKRTESQSSKAESTGDRRRGQGMDGWMDGWMEEHGMGMGGG